jgi:hypothetical protein
MRMDPRNAAHDGHHERKTLVLNMKPPTRGVVALVYGEC